jgi:hypothetical protein
MATAVVPAWVVPSAREVADLHWLAWREADDVGSPRALGVEGVLSWLAGNAPAPVTARVGVPTTRPAAETELRAAGAAQAGVPAARALVAAELGVPEWNPAPRPAAWSNAVYETLRWLLGHDGQRPPLPLPVRHADGSTLSADEVYDQAMRADPTRFVLPEQRSALRVEATRTAARHRRLAERIDDTKRRQQRHTLRAADHG